MTTQPQIVLSPDLPLACWDRFQSELASRVRECNIVSESLLWLLSRTGGRTDRVTVASALHPGDSIDCFFDAERGIITCVPGSAVRGPARQFRWGGGRLCCGSREYTAEAAAADILDELVCTDDD